MCGSSRFSLSIVCGVALLLIAKGAFPHCHSLLAKFYPPDAQMCFYIAFFNTGVTMLVFIIAEPWRQAQRQIFIQTAEDLCCADNINAVAIPIAVVIAVQRLQEALIPLR